MSLKKGKDKIWSWAPKGSPIPGRTSRLTVGRKINSTQLNSNVSTWKQLWRQPPGLSFKTISASHPELDTSIGNICSLFCISKRPREPINIQSSASSLSTDGNHRSRYMSRRNTDHASPCLVKLHHSNGRQTDTSTASLWLYIKIVLTIEIQVLFYINCG
jgi:hypothetical protein